MDWEYMVYIITASVFVFCQWIFYRVSFIKGYRAGGTKVLEQWKATLNEGNDTNELD